MRTRWLALGSFVLTLALATTARGVTLNAIDSGWWDVSGNHSAGNDNYVAGRQSNQWRDFFVFDLSSMAGSATAAFLELQMPFGGFASPDGAETWTAYDVTTPIAVLSADGTGQTAIFADLGSGASFGSRSMTTADQGTLVSVTLNANGVAAINAAAGGLFAIGGAVTTLGGLGDEYVFGFTNGTEIRRLVITTAPTNCGNGILDGGEQCDDGNLVNGGCCNASCQIEVFGTPCRPAAGPCDNPEFCNGLSPTCPIDSVAGAFVVCRSAAGACDLPESCNGTSVTCPADAKSTAVCRSAAGDCDVAETCNGVGNNCPADSVAGAFVVCRSSAGVCDLQENCDGSSVNCPADAKSSAVCRSSAGVCDLPDSCDGVNNGCPADAKSTAVCRSSAGVCDLVDSCDGVNNGCPADAKSTAICRSSAGVCDLPDSCDGVNNGCPADAKSTAVCRSSAGACDLADSCDGVNNGCPADAKSTAVCRSSAGACDLAESCDGINNGCPADAKSSAICRSSAGFCDLVEYCDGVNNGCPADGKSTDVCRSSAGACDVAESCDGSNDTCPADGFAASTTVCRSSAGTCDVAEHCTGASASCPADTGLPDSEGDGVCDAIDNCSDVSNASQSNGDGDLLGDACDPCTNIVPTGQNKAKLTLTKLLPPGGDERLVFKGFLTSVPLVPTIDPLTNGIRFLLVDSTGATPIDVTIPGGSYSVANKVGWKVNGANTAWSYKNAGSPTPLVDGIQKVQLKQVTSSPGTFKFTVKGKNGTYAVNTANLPFVGTLVIDVPNATTGQCGEVKFPATPPAKPSCTSLSGGNTVKCK